MRDVFVRPWLCMIGQKNVPIDVQTMQAAVDSVSRSNLIGNLNVEREGGTGLFLEQMKSRYREFFIWFAFLERIVLGLVIDGD